MNIEIKETDLVCEECGKLMPEQWQLQMTCECGSMEFIVKKWYDGLQNEKTEPKLILSRENRVINGVEQKVFCCENTIINECFISNNFTFFYIEVLKEMGKYNFEPDIECKDSNLETLVGCMKLAERLSRVYLETGVLN